MAYKDVTTILLSDSFFLKKRSQGIVVIVVYLKKLLWPTIQRCFLISKFYCRLVKVFFFFPMNQQRMWHVQICIYKLYTNLVLKNCRFMLPCVYRKPVWKDKHYHILLKSKCWKQTLLLKFVTLIFLFLFLLNQYFLQLSYVYLYRSAAYLVIPFKKQFCIIGQVVSSTFPIIIFCIS